MTAGRILLAIGDPNGIGPECAVKAAIGLHAEADLRPVIVGDAHIVRALAGALGAGVETDPARWGGSDRTVDLRAVEAIGAQEWRPGTISATAGRATIAYVEAAIGLVRDGLGGAIVACPHSETAVNRTGRSFSGYPNLLSELLGTGPDSVFLMLVGGGLRIVHATLHESVASALARLTPDLVVRAALAAEAALRRFGIARPRIGLFGINPHAGEGGLFGDEDERITRAAIEALRARGLDVAGPEGADTMLLREGFDAFVAMLHDQGHIPIKLKAGRDAAAFSVGGGLLFSSVGHGAAFDIAGRGVADPSGVERALRLVGAAR